MHNIVTRLTNVVPGQAIMTIVFGYNFTPTSAHVMCAIAFTTNDSDVPGGFDTIRVRDWSLYEATNPTQVQIDCSLQSVRDAGEEITAFTDRLKAASNGNVILTSESMYTDQDDCETIGWDWFFTGVDLLDARSMKLYPYISPFVNQVDNTIENMFGSMDLTDARNENLSNSENVNVEDSTEITTSSKMLS